jgi:aminopeptidase N
VATEYNAAARTYTITASQSTPPTPGQPEKGPVPIPLAVGLLQKDGTELPLRLQVWSFPFSKHWVMPQGHESWFPAGEKLCVPKGKLLLLCAALY